MDVVDGGSAVAIALETLGVTRVFAIPSAHNLAVLSALHRRGRIVVTGCRHEQGVVHAADGYARTTGGLGVAIVSTGPGTANAMGGLYEAHYASSPVLLVTTQIPTHERGRRRGFVHEAEHQADMLETVCKRVASITDPDEIAETVVALGRLARQGRPRPVAVQIPIDVQGMSARVDPARLTDTVRPTRARRPEPASVSDAARLLSAAERPVIWAGGGVLRAGAETALVDFARKWNAPVLTTREGRAAIPDDDPLSLGALGAIDPMPDYLATCDAMLAVGTRFQQYPTAGWTLPLPRQLVHLDIDPAMIDRAYPSAVALVADAREGLRALTAAIDAPGAAADAGRMRHVAAGQTAARTARELVVRHAGPDHTAISDVLNSRRSRSAVVVRDATVPAYVWGETLLAAWEPRTSIRSTGAGIGPGLPLAIGAALATGEHTILLQGDGGFMLSVGELATAVQAQARVVICLFNDSGYGMLRNIERTTGDGMQHDVDLSAPDFTTLATAFGVRSDRVGSAAEFDDALSGALAHHGPTR
nr:thiamine pyrophosphate-binding protein [Gordonia neofelifaecis]